jgi:serine/threonine protein kinase/predicted Zn-dependent protease
MSTIGQPPNNQRLGDFEIVREIGRGGMGVVYEARQVSLNRKVALKVLSGGLGLTPKAVQRFHREAEAAAKLHHTNIVPVYATGEEDGTHFYAMELIEGPSLDLVIRQMRQTKQSGTSSGEPGRVSAGSGSNALKPWGADAPPLANLETTGPYVGESSVTQAFTSSSLGSDSNYFDTVARMIAEVADALDYAHKNDVVHRDVKPSNLLLSPAGRLSLNDFGLARMLEQPGMTMTGEFVGTPAYMSPEQITAGRTPLDQRTDIYSLGATLYELLTLHPPFTGERRDQVLAQILHKEPKAPRKVIPKVPVDLETICLKAMEKDPDRRYQTAGAMAEDLRHYVNRFAISARRAGPAERLRKWMKRHPGLAAGVGLALVAICLASFFAVQSLRERRQRIIEKKQLAESLIFSGQLQEAEHEIDEAEKLGVEQDWVQWRRGQIAFHSGEIEKAIGLVNQAVAEEPENTAAYWLLGAAYHTTLAWHRAIPIYERSSSLASTSAEDRLYEGLFRSFYDPQAGLKIMDEALVQRSPLIAHVLRAQVLATLATDTSELDYIQKAMADVNAAKTIQQSNALALAESVHVHHLAAIFFEESGQTQKREAALQVAREDAKALKAFPDASFAVVIRGVFLEDQGNMEEAKQWYESALQRPGVSPSVARNYAWLLFARGEPEADKEAVRVVKRFMAPGFRQDTVLAQMVANLSPDGPAQAEKICDAVTGEPASCMYFRCNVYSYLGLKERVRELIRDFRPDYGALPPGYVAKRRDQFDLFRNPDPAFAQEVLDRHRHSKTEQANLHLNIALIRFGEHNRAGALEHLKKAVEAHEPYFPGFTSARAFLTRMKKDPNWPPWIQVKKADQKP